MRRAVGVVAGLAWAVALVPGAVRAAELPPHPALDVLVISDGVNPHGLSSAELTEPGDLKTALEATDSGLGLVAGGVTEVDSQCVDDALDALGSGAPPDVVIYFAHKAAQACGGADAQPALTTAIEGFLQTGGGVVVFHHGAYQATGKAAILDLLGIESSSIEWNTVDGQRVINVAPTHFITSHGVEYPGNHAFGAAGLGIADGDYPAFVNTPDERYPATTLRAVDGDHEILFATDSGTPRVLGYALQRPGWSGRVVAYQPGEYQPIVLDDRAGNNFQILANAILYAARLEPTESGGDADAGPSTTSDAGVVDTGGTGTAGTTTSAGTNDAGTNGAGGASGDAGTGARGGDTGADPEGSAGAAGDDRGDDVASSETDADGSGCAVTRVGRSHAAPWMWLVLAAVAGRRRRRARLREVASAR